MTRKSSITYFSFTHSGTLISSNNYDRFILIRFTLLISVGLMIYPAHCSTLKAERNISINLQTISCAIVDIL